MPTAAINDVDLYYEIHGSGDPLLLVAGLASDSQSWLPVLEGLAQQYRVIAVDNRGVGRTTPADADVSIPQIADDCIALIRHLGLSSANVLGHSMGGFAALDCAIRYPECVDKLILAATSAANSGRNNALFADWVRCLESGMDPGLWFRSLFYWLFTARFFENKQAVDEAVRFAVEYPYPQSKAALKNQVKAIAEFNCEDGLAAISAKTLVICGEEDLLFPPEKGVKLSKAIRDARVSSIPNAAHSIHMEAPQAFTHCVLGFLSTQ